MGMDAHLFCEIIESIPPPKFIRQEENNGFLFRIYQGNRGIVILDYDDDSFCDELGIHYLIQLGLGDMVQTLFPKETVSEAKSEPLTNETMGKGDCTECNGVGVMQKGEENIQCSVCEGTGTTVSI